MSTTGWHTMTPLKAPSRRPDRGFPEIAWAAAAYQLFRLHRDAAERDAGALRHSRSRRKLQPFHLYSMRQAIEEGFILDVLQNYVSYKAYYQLERKLESDPEFSGRMGSARWPVSPRCI
jgi:hypothetical protein